MEDQSKMLLENCMQNHTQGHPKRAKGEFPDEHEILFLLEYIRFCVLYHEMNLLELFNEESCCMFYNSRDVTKLSLLFCLIWQNQNQLFNCEKQASKQCEISIILLVLSSFLSWKCFK